MGGTLPALFTLSYNYIKEDKMNKSILKKLIKEEIKNILREGENEQQNYMFFQNLHTIKRMVEKMMKLNPQEVDALLSNGHGWAVDHISTAADDVGEVGTWLCNKLGHEMNTPYMMSESTHPWYTSSEGYYKGHSGIGMGPKSTYNVEAYLKPYETVYNDAGEVKTIKNLGDLDGKHKDSHITFTDDTEDLFLNWFPAKPELYRSTSKFHKTA